MCTYPIISTYLLCVAYCLTRGVPSPSSLCATFLGGSWTAENDSQKNWLKMNMCKLKSISFVHHSEYSKHSKHTSEQVSTASTASKQAANQEEIRKHSTPSKQ